MKKRIIASAMTVLFAVSMLAGCGSTGGTQTTSTDAAATTAESVETADADTSDTAKAADTDTSADASELKDALKGVTLKVGTTGLFGPFSYYDEDGKTLIGYDIDMLADLQDLLGFDIDGGALQAMDYSAITASLAEGKLDIGAAALCATDERKAVMGFSPIYCDSGQVVMVNSDDDKGIKGVEDLAGKKVAVEKGTASHTYASKNLPDSTLEVHDTITTAYESLEQGKVDAVIQDGPGAAFYIKTTADTKLEVVGDEFNQGQAPYCVAISNDCKYGDIISQGVQYLIDNGTTEELYKKWCE